MRRATVSQSSFSTSEWWREQHMTTAHRAIWDCITTKTGQPELTEAQREELERRLAVHTAVPEDVIPWEDVKVNTLVKAR
jgi:putative addiction module component (TIGR02574 family)